MAFKTKTFSVDDQRATVNAGLREIFTLGTVNIFPKTQSSPVTNKGLFYQDRILELRIGNLYILIVEDNEELSISFQKLNHRFYLQPTFIRKVRNEVSMMK